MKHKTYQYGNTFYCLGGVSPGGQYNADVYYYNISGTEDKWEKQPLKLTEEDWRVDISLILVDDDESKMCDLGS